MAGFDCVPWAFGDGIYSTQVAEEFGLLHVRIRLSLSGCHDISNTGNKVYSSIEEEPGHGVPLSLPPFKEYRYVDGRASR